MPSWWRRRVSTRGSTPSWCGEKPRRHVWGGAAGLSGRWDEFGEPAGLAERASGFAELLGDVEASLLDRGALGQTGAGEGEEALADLAEAAVVLSRWPLEVEGLDASQGPSIAGGLGLGAEPGQDGVHRDVGCPGFPQPRKGG